MQININNEFIEKLDSALIGYIDNENGNTVDWLLAEILELNRKKYITIDYLKTGIDKYEYIIRKNKEMDIQNLEKYEMTAYRLLFDYCDELTMHELEERIKKDILKVRDTNVKGFSIKKEIEEKLIEIELLDYKSKKILHFIQIIYMLFAVIFIFYIKQIETYIATIVSIQLLLIIFIAKKARPFTLFGKQIYTTIKKYKKTLKENDLLKDKKIIHNVLLEKEYSNAIALHLTEEAKKEFINDEIIKKESENMFLSLMYYIGIVIYIFCYLSLFI